MFFSTLDARGRAKGVPAWFNFHEGVMYLVSMKDSVKVAKIRKNPRVRLRVLEGGGGGERPPGEMDAVAEPVEDERLAWALFRKKNEKYDKFYGETTREN